MNKFFRIITVGAMLFSVGAVWGSESDSLRMELERLSRRLDQLEKAEKVEENKKVEESASLNQASKASEDSTKREQLLEDMNNNPYRISSEEKEPLVEKKTSKEEKEELFSETEALLAKLNKKMDRFNSSGFGGSGGPTPRIMALDVRPLKDLIARDMKRPESPFASNNLGTEFQQAMAGDYETLFLMGGFGFGGIGNGLRIGGGGYGGERTYKIDKKGITYNLQVDVGYGGVLLEKAFTYNRNNIAIGTLLGAGGMTARLFEGDETSGFSESNNSVELNYDSGYSANSAFFLGDIHVGYTYTFISWLHFGVEAGCNMMYSNSGLWDSDISTTFNPTGALRILFGNLG